MGDAIKLIGIVIAIIGFALKFDTLATVVVAGIVTGLVGGMSIMDILSTLGAAFLYKPYCNIIYFNITSYWYM